MSERCPKCGHIIGEDGPCEVHAEVTDTDSGGLRVDLAVVCDGCDGNVVIEDIPADEGLVGHLLDDLNDFDGRGYRA